MRRAASLSSAILLALPATAQIPPDDAVVVTRLPGNPVTRLLEVDLATGSFAALGGFPHDSLAPLAVDIDPVNRDVVLAVDLLGGSRLLRLQLSGRNVVAERVLADLPGRVSHLNVAAVADLFALTDGPGGGVWRVPRNGGMPVQIAALPRASAMTDTGIRSESATVVQSGVTGPPRVDPSGSMVALLTGQMQPVPWMLPSPVPVGVTGVYEIPAALPRWLFSHDDGTISMVTLPPLGNPMTLPLQPPLPGGGAVAMRGFDSTGPIVLGGAARPFLQTFDPFQAAPTFTVLAGPLPGDPVDYSLAPTAAGFVQEFGSVCGAPGVRMWGNLRGRPRLGNQAFSLTAVNAPPSAPVVLALGFSERVFAGTPLPVTLPNGCPLVVSPELVSFHVTDAFGNFERVLPIPGNPLFLGFTFFGQWLLPIGPPFPVSQGAAVHVGT